MKCIQCEGVATMQATHKHPTPNLRWSEPFCRECFRQLHKGGEGEFTFGPLRKEKLGMKEN